MNVLVTGALGQLGQDVMQELKRRNIPCKGVDRQDFDLCDREETFRAVAGYTPDAIIHCAAYTAVDKAESEKELCYQVNVEGTENLALAAKDAGAKMIYISTDYVFDGQGDAPFEPSRKKDPVNYYGLTKAQGEDTAASILNRLFILRISWVFGLHGGNFVKTMMRLGSQREEVRVVDDQTGSPTYTADLAPLICDMIATDKFGVYHATNEGLCTWWEFASAIMQEAGLDCRVTPIKTAEYPTAARRPYNSRLSKKRLDDAGFSRLPPWQDALKRYIASLKKLEQEA